MAYMDNIDIFLHDFTGSLQNATGFRAEHEEVGVQFGDRCLNERLNALVQTMTPDGD